ncbi:serine-rich adhesin for platelets-like [Anopheles nili]|uniref:serine-rich adhesin for platelets-like n=1 Tax=Anopheles nili TaxID=185578 RepID=UPI00237AC58E|nr:serine-rich adhesin for platelets-like [Anopheles nili]
MGQTSNTDGGGPSVSYTAEATEGIVPSSDIGNDGSVVISVASGGAGSAGVSNTTISNIGTESNTVDGKSAVPPLCSAGCSSSGSSCSSSSSSSSSSSNSSNGGGGISNSNGAAAAIALALNQQSANVPVGSSAAAAAAAVVALVGRPLMEEYIKSDAAGVGFPLPVSQPSSPMGSCLKGEGSSQQQHLVSSLQLQSQSQALSLHQHHQQTAALPLLSPKSPPCDDQPCDLRMLTPTTYLREFAGAVKPESIAAAAAVAVQLAASANTGSASTTAALPIPMFKGMSMTTPPPQPGAMPSPIVGDGLSMELYGSQMDIVKEEEKITDSIIADSAVHVSDQDGENEYPVDEDEMVAKIHSTLHQFEANDGNVTTAASLFEESLGLSFGSSISVVGGSANQTHQQGSLNDDIALMVGRPDGDGYFHCPADSCDRKYKIKYSLLRHLRNECNADRRYSCPKCDKRFSYSFILNRHLLKVHKESPGYY